MPLDVGSGLAFAAAAAAVAAIPASIGVWRLAGGASRLLPAALAATAGCLMIAAASAAAARHSSQHARGFAVLGSAAVAGSAALLLVDAHRLAARLSRNGSHLWELAFTDALTGVANRRELLRVLDEDARGGPPCVLLAIDLDGFKKVNDLRGHDVGDMVLAEIGRRLRANLRPGDVAARMGGDEFAVLMWASLADAISVTQRLLGALSEPHHTAGGSVYVSASVGVAGCASATDVPSLLRNADLALRFAKQRGKNRFECYDMAYDQWSRRRTGIEHEMRGAIGRDEFHLAYQPVIDLATRRVVGVEALLRWEHSRLGAVPPDEFIPIAEDSGLIRDLDQWVLHQACRQLSHWLGDGHDIWLSVNISARELHLFDYVAHIEKVLRAHQVPAERLVLEITEHAVALDPDELVGQLRGLRSVGVKIALDDFGTGYSSLGQLRSLPVDILKIDRSLVGDPDGPDERDRDGASLVDVVVTLGRRLDLTVIAEGVARPADLAAVERAGGTLIQGEMFGRAMPAERLEAMLSGEAAVSGEKASRDDASLPSPRAHDVGQLDSGREMRQS